MDWIGIVIVAVIVVAVIALVARRWQGDKPSDRGPYSTAMDARGGLAAFGATIDEPPRDDPDGEADPDKD